MAMKARFLTIGARVKYKLSKYKNIKTVVDGIKFASKREAARYCELKLLLKAGKITDLHLQTAFVLAPSVRLLDKKRARPALRIIVDFCYLDDCLRFIIEDTKGFETPLSLAKRHLLKHIYGLDVRIIK